MSQINVLLADDHTVVRSGLRKLLEQEPDIHVVGEARDGDEALRLVKELDPDVLLLDIEMPGRSGLQVAKQLHEARSPVRVLALSAYADRQYTLNLLANGAAGYLTKEEAPRRVVKAVRGVFNGQEGWLSRRVALQLIAWAQEGQLNKRELNDSEKKTLQMVVAGKTNKEIGVRLGLDTGTVEKRLQTILTKLGGTSRTKAAMQAAREGLVSGELSRIRVLVVEEIRLLGDMLAALLEEEPDVMVVGCATTFSEVLAQLDRCDLVLVNANLPDDNALKLVETISEVEPTVKALVMGLQEIEPAVIQYIEAGAVGYVRREDSTEELLEHIRAAHRDAALVSPAIAAALMSRVSELARWAPERGTLPGCLDQLTPREREVLELLGRGLSNKQIAQRLFIVQGTVKNHVHSIYQKLDVHSRQEATAYAPLLEKR